MFKVARVFPILLFFLSGAVHAWPSFKRNRCQRFYNQAALAAKELESYRFQILNSADSRYLYEQLYSGDDMGQFNSLRIELFENRGE